MNSVNLSARNIQITLPAVLFVGLFWVTSFAIMLPSYRETVRHRKREVLLEVTNGAYSILSHYEHARQRGEMSLAIAQREATAMIRNIRYGPEGKDYFWINDMEPRMLMHPHRPDLEGRSVANLVDPTGKRLFLEMTSLVEAQGSGYTTYMWQKPNNPASIVPKLSYVRGFPEWGWIIGTGVYLCDVNAEIASITTQMTLICGGILLLVALLATYAAWHSAKTDRERQQAEKRLSEYREHLEDTVHERTLQLQEQQDHLEQLVAERTSELIRSNEDLQREISERREAESELAAKVHETSEAKHRLEVLVSNTTDREKQMLELKREVNQLLADAGKQPKYEAPAKVDDLVDRNSASEALLIR